MSPEGLPGRPGVNQRAQVRMTEAEIADHLRGRHTMALSSIGPSGLIHSVAMWYAVLDGEVWVETKAKSQKVRNLRRDDRLTGLVEDGETYATLRGVQLAGRGEIHDDAELVARIGAELRRRHLGERAPVAGDPARVAFNRVAIRLVVESVASWDHRKLVTTDRS